jgi:transcriptional regulator with XRE-family HTH domain
MDMRYMRRALGLRLIDVERATGIDAGRISLAERGLTRLGILERRAIENFLRSRLASEIRTEEEQ